MNIEESDIADLYQKNQPVLDEQDLRLLKGVLTDLEVARYFSTTTQGKLFVGEAKPFMHLAMTLYQRHGSLPTRRMMLEQAGSKADSFSYIWDEIEEIQFNKQEFNYDLEKLKQRYANERVSSIRAAIDQGLEIDPLLREIKKNLDDAEKTRSDSRKSAFVQRTMQDYISQFRQEYIEKRKDPEKGKGILTQYSYIDYVTNGLSPSDMLLVAGETGAGKSLFLINLAIQMWMQSNTIYSNEFSKGYNIQYFSLEMPFDQCFRRAFSRLGTLPTYGLRDAQISEPDMLKRMSKAANFIKNFPNQFEIVDIPRGVTIDDIEDRYLDAVARGVKPDVVVVDYLGLMQDPKSQGDDWLKLGNIAGHLHEFARTYNVVLLSAVQLNRSQGKKTEETIGLHRIGRSSLIMHHATIGIQIETRKEEESMPDMRYHIIKNRNGERGAHNIKRDFRTATLIDFEEGYTPKYDSTFNVVNPAMEDLSSVFDEFGWNA